jgi:hypothetical protein
MKIITLPFLDEHASAQEGVRAMRARHVGGLVSIHGLQFRVYRFSQVAAAARQKPPLPLMQVAGLDLPELPIVDAVAHGLSFTQPSVLIFGAYLNRRPNEAMVTATTGDASAEGAAATIAFRNAAIAQNFAVYPKAWVCPTDFETWDDQDKPADGLCPTHKVTLVEDT